MGYYENIYYGGKLRLSLKNGKRAGVAWLLQEEI